MRRLRIEGARVWDGISDRTSDAPVSVDVIGDRVESLGRAAASGPSAQVLQCEPGSVLIPGLIDSHVHLCLDPKLRTPDEQRALPRETVRAAVQSRAEQMLRAGITTLRDLGGGDGFEIELRDRINRGELSGPRILCAGQPLTSVGGHCHFWGGEADGPEQFRSVIERQVAAGVDWIKVMATGGLYTRGTRASAAQFDREELSLACGIASQHGRPVAPHCHGTEGIRNSPAAGVRTIEHCSFAGSEGFGSDFQPELCAQIAAAGIWVSPTINAGWGRFRAGESDSRFFRAMSRVLAQLLQAGVSLVASTDAGIPNVQHGDLARALLEMQAFTAQTPLQVLRSATRVAAQALQLEHETGSLVPGLSADLVVLPGDPLEDLEFLQRPSCVVMRGDPVSL